MLDKVQCYENKILKFIYKYEVVFQKYISFHDRFFIAVIEGFEKLVFGLLDLIAFFSKIARYSTYPLHWIWIKIFLKQLQKEKLTDLPIFKLGAHYFYGLPEAGKSTVVYHAMMDYAYYTGKTSYTTAMMETPRKNVFGQEYYYHQFFSPSEFFKDGEQVVQFNTLRHNIIVYEELLTQYHQRDNKKRDYNAEVLPMIASMGNQRHQKIDLFYFISQLPRNDISIMQMLAGYHEPRIVKRFDYKNWLKTGKIRFTIKGWRMTSYSILSSASEYKKVNKIRWFYKNKYSKDFEYFNRLNMEDKYKHLKLHKGVEMK